MSNAFYERKWHETIKAMQDICEQELEPMKNIGTKKNFTTEEWFKHFSLIYIAYLEIYKNLEDCFENCIQPQKRVLMKSTLISVIKRLLEIRRDLVQFNVSTPIINSEFINFEELLTSIHKLPSVLNIRVPRFYSSDSDTKITDRDLLISQLMRDHGDIRPEIEKKILKSPEEMSIAKAIELLSKLERGRQGIEVGLEKKEELLEIFKKQQRQKILAEKGEKEEVNETEEAIILIQKYLRGLIARQTVLGMRDAENQFLGFKQNVKEIVERAAELEALGNDRIAIRKEKEKELDDKKRNLKENIIEKEGLDIRCEMLEERRRFIIDYYETKEGKELPADENEFYKRLDLLPPLSQAEMEEKRKEEAKNEKKPAPKPSDGKKKETEQEAFLREHQEKGPAVSQALPEIQILLQQFNEVWWTSESNNDPMVLNTELILKEVVPEIKETIKQEMDKVIKIELDSLHQKLNITRKKETKIKPVKPVRPKKLPGEALAGNKDPRDFLPILIEANILKNIPNVSFDDFEGSENLVRGVQESQSVNQPDPSLPQLKRTIIEQMALPQVTGFNVAGTPRTFLFYGPPGSGKTFLAHALVKETKSIFLDFSPEIIAENVADKNAIAKLVYIVFKIAREFQPSIIYIDEIEHFFPKKNVKKFKPKCVKFKKDLMAQIQKQLLPSDAVTVIACTSQPQFLNVPDVKKLFTKSFYFPFPDYASRLQIFKNALNEQGIDGNSFYALQNIALNSEGYTAGSIKRALKKAFSKERKEKLCIIPLSPEELILPLSKMPYCSADDYAAMQEMTNLLLDLQEKRSRKEEMEKERLNAGKNGKNNKPVKK
jgi:SpoVK/Ycf46/Vps4 family AAA+-type ATPase